MSLANQDLKENIGFEDSIFVSSSRRFNESSFSRCLG